MKAYSELRHYTGHSNQLHTLDTLPLEKKSSCPFNRSYREQHRSAVHLPEIEEQFLGFRLVA